MGLVSYASRASRCSFRGGGHVSGDLTSRINACYQEALLDDATVEVLLSLIRSACARVSGKSARGADRSGQWVEISSLKGRVRAVEIKRLPAQSVRAVGAEMRRLVSERGLPVRISDGGLDVGIHALGASKGRAALAFAEVLNMSPSALVRIGDQAAEGGNDVTLVVGPRGFNVGCRPALDPTVQRTRATGARGTASILRGLRPSQELAVATDYDGTLTSREGDGHLDSEACRELVRHLNGGTRVAIITGRGPVVLERVVPALRAGGLRPSACSNLTFALLNGSAFVSPLDDLTNECAAREV